MKENKKNTTAIGNLPGKKEEYPFFCNNIYLVSSNFLKINEDNLESDAPKTSSYNLKIEGVIRKEVADVQLIVKVLYRSSKMEAPFEGSFLEFSLNGCFGTIEGVPSQEFVSFIRLYPLSILWPYAREYASEIFRRAGIKSTPLPIINPQKMTEDLLKKESISIIVNND